MKFGCTDLVIGVSQAKKCMEYVGDIRFTVALHQFNKNCEKPCFLFCSVSVFRFFTVVLSAKRRAGLKL